VTRRSPSGERAEGDLIRAARRRPPAIPQHGRGLRRYGRAHHGYKLQLGKVGTGSWSGQSRSTRTGEPVYRAGPHLREGQPSPVRGSRIMPPSAVPFVRHRPLPQSGLLHIPEAKLFNNRRIFDLRQKYNTRQNIALNVLQYHRLWLISYMICL